MMSKSESHRIRWLRRREVRRELALIALTAPSHGDAAKRQKQHQDGWLLL